MLDSELLACPFCGGEPSYGQSLTGGQTWLDHVECLSCGAMCQSCYSMSDAKEAWNKRTLPNGVSNS